MRRFFSLATCWFLRANRSQRVEGLSQGVTLVRENDIAVIHAGNGDE